MSQITWVPVHGLTIICLNYISWFSLLINDILCPKISLNFNNIGNILTISWLSQLCSKPDWWNVLRIQLWHWLNYTSGRQWQEGRQLTVLWQPKYKSLKVPQKTDGITIKIQTGASGKILVLIKVPQKNWRHPNKNLNTGKNPGILMGVIIQYRSLSGTNYRCAQFTGIHPHRLVHEPA